MGMIKQISTGLLAGAAFLLPTLEERASARSVSAITAVGFTWHPIEDDCGHYDYDTGVLSTTCPMNVIVPLTTDHSGTKTLQFTARALWPTLGDAGPMCRAVATDRFGSAFSASNYIEFPTGTGTFTSSTTDSVVVPSKGVFLADCLTNETTELNEFDYAP